MGAAQFISLFAQQQDSVDAFCTSARFACLQTIEPVKKWRTAVGLAKHANLSRGHVRTYYNNIVIVGVRQAIKSRQILANSKVETMLPRNSSKEWPVVIILFSKQSRFPPPKMPDFPIKVLEPILPMRMSGALRPDFKPGHFAG